MIFAITKATTIPKSAIGTMVTVAWTHVGRVTPIPYAITVGWNGMTRSVVTKIQQITNTHCAPCLVPSILEMARVTQRKDSIQRAAIGTMAIAVIPPAMTANTNAAALVTAV